LEKKLLLHSSAFEQLKYMEASAPKALNQPKIIRAWTFFDWANSAFSLVISSAVFPAYFLKVTDDQLQVGGMTLSNSSLYAYALSFSYLIIAICSPILSGIADYGGRRMLFLRIFTTIGSIGCASLFFFEGMTNLWLGVGGFTLATIGFAGGLVFYNAYLPQIASEDRYDQISARGFAMGYIGSVLLLLVNLAIILNAESLGFKDQGAATRLAFLMVGLWWIGFAQIPFRSLPKDIPKPPNGHLLTRGFEELAKAASSISHSKNIIFYLSAFFFYSVGVQTALYLAATFAEKELQFETVELIIIILILQLVGIAGAYLFARISDWRGNKFSLMMMLIIWVGICVAAYNVESKLQFYFLAAAVGIVMGGIQSLSRSTYSKLIPSQTEDTTSFFSFYDVLEKAAIILGTFGFGFIEQLTGNMRSSILLLGICFVIGIALLSRVTIKHAKLWEEKS
jgi:UMF1 family MFS transporter